ncbi:hypothetical protein M407DRAFT_243369, partial [Tulasnella calospora MUT 4182]
ADAVLSIKDSGAARAHHHYHRQDSVAIVSQHRDHHSRNYPPLTSSLQLPSDIPAPTSPATSDS